VSTHTSEFLFSTINTGHLIMCEDDQGVPLLLLMMTVVIVHFDLREKDGSIVSA
jgi:hypothetical protein